MSRSSLPFGLNPEAFPSLAHVHETFIARHRFSAEIVSRGIAEFGAPWAGDFETLLHALFPSASAREAAVKGYAAFAMHSMRLQAAFERERRYKPKTHQEASSEVYLNEQHMFEEYLPGLLLSHFLWPHHYRQLQFFDSAFVQRMRVAGAQSFLEVGIGTGLYSSRVLGALPSIEGVGLDISPSSRDFTLRQVAALGAGPRYRVELRDVVTSPSSAQTSWLICVEVLEHLEDPSSFLRALRREMAPGARAFITAAVNAAHADHIYLYESAGQVLSQLQDAGFTLEQSFVAAAYKPSNSGAPVPEAAAFIVT